MKRAGERGRSRLIVPVFPLPNVFLFPGCLMPLHIFEPRYRQMIEDLLDRPGRLVMGTILEGETDVAGAPRLFHVGGLGEIGRHERLDDGRFIIWLVGLARVRMAEVPSDRLYRKVSIEPLEEVTAPPGTQTNLRARIQKAVLARAPELANLPDEVPLSHLADLLLQRLQLPQSTMQALYAEVDVARRARGALREHARRDLPPAKSQS